MPVRTPDHSGRPASDGISDVVVIIGAAARWRYEQIAGPDLKGVDDDAGDAHLLADDELRSAREQYGVALWGVDRLLERRRIE